MSSCFYKLPLIGSKAAIRMRPAPQQRQSKDEGNSWQLCWLGVWHTGLPAGWTTATPSTSVPHFHTTSQLTVSQNMVKEKAELPLYHPLILTFCFVLLWEEEGVHNWVPTQQQSYWWEVNHHLHTPQTKITASLNHTASTLSPRSRNINDQKRKCHKDSMLLWFSNLRKEEKFS